MLTESSHAETNTFFCRITFIFFEGFMIFKVRLVSVYICFISARMSMYRPHWIPDAQHWSSMPTTTTPSRVTPPGSNSPPKDHELPPPPPASSSSSSVSTTGAGTKLETNYESLNHPPTSSAGEEATKDVVKAEAESVKPLHTNYSDYYSHYNPHNDLSSAFINCNSSNSVRSVNNHHSAASPVSAGGGSSSSRPSSSSKSAKNRPNAGT